MRGFYKTHMQQELRGKWHTVNSTTNLFSKLVHDKKAHSGGFPLSGFNFAIKTSKMSSSLFVKLS